MKAAVFHKPGQSLSIETLPDPIPEPGQVVIKVGRCGICGSDLHLTDGKGYTSPPGTVLGHEFSGEVAALGVGVEELSVGDRVTALPLTGCGKCPACLQGQTNWCSKFAFRPGGFAEYVIADARNCIMLPDIVSLEDGAMVEPLAVAWHAVKLAGIQPGAKVAVLGAGPIGLASIYWLKQLGCTRITVGAASTRRAALATTMGASSFFINDDKAVESVTGQLGGLPDLVLECVGLPGMIARATELAKPRGTVVIAGFCNQMDSFRPMTALVKELRLLFSIMYSRDDFQYVVDTIAADKSKVYRAMITDTVSLQAFPEVFEALRGRNHQCKVMLSP